MWVAGLATQTQPRTAQEVDVVNAVSRTMMRTAGKLAVTLYRRSGGRIGGKALGGAPVLLLTVAGRRTGKPHTTAVSYFDHLGGYVVVGSAGGTPEDPQWFRNLRKASQATVEVGSGGPQPVGVRVLKGAERDTVWEDVVLARVPEFAKYETKSGRRMPLALLMPVA
jgi:deazaflavin-dependent oxidoreductase (nitroreductase family)